MVNWWKQCGGCVHAVTEYINDDDREVKNLRHGIDWPEEIHTRYDSSEGEKLPYTVQQHKKRNNNFLNRIFLREKPSGR